MGSPITSTHNKCLATKGLTCKLQQALPQHTKIQEGMLQLTDCPVMGHPPELFTKPSTPMDLPLAVASHGVRMTPAMA
eukprot:360374-Chlamydomonas_euryale.AAC.6